MSRARFLMPGAMVAAGLLALWTANGQAQDAPGGNASVAVSAEGRQVYEEICQACHMADGKGGGPTGAMIPSLAANAKLADKDYGIALLLKGRAGMPWFTDILTKEQMAAVLTFVRSHFNDFKEPVTVADIERVAAASPAAAPREDAHLFAPANGTLLAGMSRHHD